MVVKDRKEIHKLQDIFSSIDALYIADGHHRSASSALYANKEEENPNYTGTESFNFCMSYLIPESQLQILSLIEL